MPIITSGYSAPASAGADSPLKNAADKSELKKNVKKSYYRPKFNQVNSRYSFDNDLTRGDIERLCEYMNDRIKWLCLQQKLRPHDIAVIAGTGREQVRLRLEKTESARQRIKSLIDKDVLA